MDRKEFQSNLLFSLDVYTSYSEKNKVMGNRLYLKVC